MKTFVLIAITTLCLTAKSQTVDTQFQHETINVSNPITRNFSHGFRMHEKSDLNGACVAMGYFNAVPGSESFDFSYDAVKMEITGADGKALGYTEEPAYYIKNISCVKRTPAPQYKQVVVTHVITRNFSHGFRINEKSDLNGACIAMGYFNAVPGSESYDFSYDSVKMEITGANGKATRYSNTPAYFIRKITCNVKIW